MNKKYEDILNIDYEKDVKAKSRFPRMSDKMRASQFAPFAALTGFSDEISDTADAHIVDETVSEAFIEDC